MNGEGMHLVRRLTFLVVAIVVVSSGCKTGTEPFAVQKTERRITEAIASGQYETADRFIAQYEAEAAGGLFCDRRLLRWALVKFQMGKYADATALTEQILNEDPESTCRDSALAIRKAIQEKENKSHNKAPESDDAPAPQVPR